MERVPTLRNILELVQNNELRTAIDDLLVICEISNQKDLFDDLINLKGRLSKNNRADRNGLISKSDFDMEENKIRHAIIQIKAEVEDVPLIHMTVRRGIKELIRLQRAVENYIFIDYSEVTEGKVDKLKFHLAEYENIGDLMNAVYLEMTAFFNPFTYRESWILVDSKGNDAYDSIVDRVNNIDIRSISNFEFISGSTFFIRKI